MLTTWIQAVYQFLWGDLLRIPLPGGSSFGVSLLIILLIPTGIYFTIRTRFLPVRLFGDMVRALTGKKKEDGSLSTFQTLIVSTATRVGMGNLVGVVAAVSAGGAGAVFWMWITAVIGSSTAFIEATLAQLYKEKDPLYGGYRGGPAYYMHHYVERRTGKTKKHVCIAVLFAISGLICWAGISQVISNSVASSFENAFGIPPIFTTVILVVVAAVIVLRKNATVKVLDILVPIMAVCYFVITIVIILLNIRSLPGVFERIIQEAFGIRQAAAGGFGAVLMNGVKRGLFSNEAKTAESSSAKEEETEEQTECELEDGTYTAEFKTDSGMFHVNEANDGKGTLTVKDGKMTIHVSLVSKNIVNLFEGTSEDAQKDGAELLEPTTDTVTYSDGATEEVYGFDIPVPELDKEFDVALIGKKGVWYDHKVSVTNPVKVEE